MLAYTSSMHQAVILNFKFKCLLYSDDEVVSNLHNHIAAN